MLSRLVSLVCSFTKGNIACVGRSFQTHLVVIQQRSMKSTSQILKIVAETQSMRSDERGLLYDGMRYNTDLLKFEAFFQYETPQPELHKVERVEGGPKSLLLGQTEIMVENEDLDSLQPTECCLKNHLIGRGSYLITRMDDLETQLFGVANFSDSTHEILLPKETFPQNQLESELEKGEHGVSTPIVWVDIN